MGTTKYTFWSLINKYCIEIPPIQRDYAQGRDNDKANRIRRDFLKRLKEALSGNSPLNLDFVYGSTMDDSDRRGTIFIPLDGQQRLTTLFLLHWYLATRDGCAVENRSIFTKFSYQTRPSSTAFCNRLVNQGIDRSRLESGFKEFKELIVDSNWFHHSWLSDPTVNAMLTMLNDIHNQFGDMMGGFQILTRDEKPPITFDFLPLEMYHLTDELYVRMNARGKPLTEFENFKARFTDLLKNRDDDWLCRVIKNFSAEMNLESWVTENFSKKMDNEWTDLFWAKARPPADPSSRSALSLTVDHCLMHYIVFITEMLYAETFTPKGGSPFDPDKPLDYDLVEQVYFSEKPENTQFLLHSLDFWAAIGFSAGDDPSLWMSELFSGRHEPGKVVLFFDEDQAKQDLWTRCITGNGFGYYEKILLFALTRRGVWLMNLAEKVKQMNQSAVDYQNPRHYTQFARVIRNLLQTVRYLDKAITRYEPNLTFELMGSQLNSLKNLIEREDVDAFFIAEDSRSRELAGFSKFALEWEVDKAKLVANHLEWKEQVERLEDHPNLRGILVNLLGALKEAIDECSDEVIDIAKDFEDIWAFENRQNDLIVRAFLAAEDYSIENERTWYRLKYFGSPNRWNSILTYDRPNHKDKVGKALRKFLKQYRDARGSAEKRLDEIVVSYMKYPEENGKKDWRYYFIKYPAMVTWKTDWGDATAQNLFAWFANEYETRMLKTSSLQGYHINPYVRAVAAGVFHETSDPRVNPEKYNYASGLYSQDYAFQNLSSHFDFQPKDGVKMKCLQEGWKVTFTVGSPYRERWQKLGLEQESECVYWLCHNNDSEDRVQKAINFVLSLE